MIAYGNRYKRNLGKPRAEIIAEQAGSKDASWYARWLKNVMAIYDEHGVANEWTYYSAGGGLMRLYATEKMAQSRNPKGEVFAVEVPE